MRAGVPVLDFRAWREGGAARDRFAADLGAAIEALGFVALEGHGVPDSLLERAYTLAQRTFALPEAVKRRYETPEDGRQRGYTAFGVEHAKDRAVPDLKEFWHVGREPTPGSALPANQIPGEVEGFDDTFGGLFAALDELALELLDALGQHLDTPRGHLADMARGGNSVLRVIHYPPLPEAAPPGAVRAAEHEDINLITVLPVSTQAGLQLLTRDGEWVDVVPPPGVMVCDTGDMMQLLTGGRVPATTHRVVNPTDGSQRHSRYSMPFFAHPRPEVRLDPLVGDEPGPTAQDFLDERLRAIGLAD